MLPDLLAPGLAVVFCGTAAGSASARAGHYYAGPGNRFWPLLAETGLTPRRLAPAEGALAARFGIGLTDIAKGVAGADRDIPRAAYDPEGLVARIAPLAPRALAFTSLTAARAALGRRCAPGPQPERPFGPSTAVWALPSPSGAARGHFSAAPWHALARFLRGAETAGAPSAILEAE